MLQLMIRLICQLLQIVQLLFHYAHMNDYLDKIKLFGSPIKHFCKKRITKLN